MRISFEGYNEYDEITYDVKICKLLGLDKYRIKNRTDYQIPAKVTKKVFCLLIREGKRRGDEKHFSTNILRFFLAGKRFKKRRVYNHGFHFPGKVSGFCEPLLDITNPTIIKKILDNDCIDIINFLEEYVDK